MTTTTTSPSTSRFLPIFLFFAIIRATIIPIKRKTRKKREKEKGNALDGNFLSFFPLFLPANSNAKRRC